VLLAEFAARRVGEDIVQGRQDRGQEG